MKDLTLDFQNKKIKNTFISNRDLVLQQICLVVQVWYQDWYLDYYFGIKYKTRLANKPMLLADLENAITSINGVNSVKNLAIVEDIVNKLKVYYVTGTIVFQNETIELKNGEVVITGV